MPIELLNNTAGKKNYSIKQLKVDQVIVQTNTPETFRKVTRTLKEKNSGHHTYQLKADESCKIVIRVRITPKNKYKYHMRATSI